MAQEMMDLDQLAIYLQRDAREVSRMASRGYLPGHKVSGQWRFHPAEINHWIETQMHAYTEQELTALEKGPERDLDQQPLLSVLLTESTTAVPFRAATRASVLKELVRLAEQSWQVYDPEAVFEAIKQREEMGSTALDSGVAVPHPRRPLPKALGDHVVAYGRTIGGIAFGAPRGGLTDMFFMICCRDDRTQLRVLARLSRLMLRPGFLEELRAAETAVTPRALIEALHRESPYQYALALAGGGTGAAAALLNVPGGSRTLLEVSIPYNQQALTEYLGRAPEQFCSSATSLTLARRALERARWLAPGQPVAGVGCTASLATDRPKKGDHRFHIALVWSGSGGGTVSLGLRKGERNRDQEEALLDAVLLNGMAEAFGIAGRLDLALLPGEHLDIVACQASPLELMLAGDPTAPAAIHVEPDGQHALRAPLPLAVLPGAFNPTHHAHWGLAEVAARQLALPVAFEMSVHNVDKGTLPAEEVRRRLGQFIWRAPVWVTRAATFVEKASLFPGVAFVVGADTAARILAPRYYKEGDAGVTTALQFLRRQGCRFLVACRVDGPGNCLALADLPIPVEARDLFTAIPAETFRIDVSSTQLRERSS